MKVFLPLQVITVLFSAFHVNADDTAKVVCGGGLGNKRCADKNLETKVVSKDERYGARCCSDTPFLRSKLQDQFGCSVYGGTITNVSGPGLELVRIRKGEEFFCPKAVTYAEAQTHCSNMGARMCTEEELNNKCAKATGCNLNQALVWASDQASTPFPSMSPSIEASSTPSVSESVLDEFDFYPLMDSPDDGIGKISGGIEVYAKECMKNDNCAGFNSNGWLKHTIRRKSQWYQFTDDTSLGLYVKKSYKF